MKNFFFKNYFDQFKLDLTADLSIISKLERIARLFKTTHKNKKKIIFMGNGGSAAMSSHVSVDLTKNAKVRAINFNESDLITCLSNDYGHDNWMKSALELYCDKGDVVVLISTSGESKNIVNAARWCLKNRVKLISFTGRNKKNKLKTLNKKSINCWVDSNSYNHVEMIHHVWLLSIVDNLIGKSEYEPN